MPATRCACCAAGLGFTFTALLTWTAGIGLTTAVYSVISAVLIRELPFENSARLVRLADVRRRDGQVARVSPGNFVDWKRETRTLDALALATFWPGRLQGPDGDPEQAAAMTISHGFFEMLGVAPEQGRLFTPDEYGASMPIGSDDTHPTVAIVSHEVSQRLFQGHGVGATVQFGGRSLAIVGVMPEDFDLEGISDRTVAPELWVPGVPEEQSRGARLAEAVGRLAPGATVQAAQRELDVISQRLSAAYPAENRDWSVRVATPLASATNNVRRQISLLAAAACCVLLIACANVANLLLASSSSRRAELATRVAIGASRGRLISQLLTESVMLSLLGGLGGVLLAQGAVRALTTLAPGNIPRLDEIVVDGRVLIFAFGLAIAVGIGCGLVASLSSTGPQKDLSSRAGRIGVVSRRRFREGLTVLQVALALVLVVAAGLLGRTVRAVGRVELGFDPHQVISVQLNPDLRTFRRVRAVSG